MTVKFVSTYNDLVEIATEILYAVDPASTDCNLNDMFDEYENEAALIAEYFIKENMMLKRAMFRAFDKQFDGHYDEAKLTEAYRKINEYLV